MKLNEHIKPAENIDEYLATVPEETRTVLEELRKTIKAAAPKAEEVISYQIPSFNYSRPPGLLCRIQGPLQFLCGE